MRVDPSVTLRHIREVERISDDEYLGVLRPYAERRFGPVPANDEPVGECISGLVLRGERRPPECPAFGKRCTPQHPLGALMVSAEGACAAYYRYRGWEVIPDGGLP